MNRRRVFGSALMSFFLGLLFYLIAAAIMDSLPELILSANIRGRDVNIATDIIRPFAGNPPPLTEWNIQDTAVLIVIWSLAGMIGGFAGRNKLEGALGTLFAYVLAVGISIFVGPPLIGNVPMEANILEIVWYRMSNLIITEELLRIVLFGFIALLSGYYFGYLSKKDRTKVEKFWLQLDESSNKIKLSFHCPFCNTPFESNPLYCSSCGKKVREEVKASTA